MMARGMVSKLAAVSAALGSLFLEMVRAFLGMKGKSIGEGAQNAVKKGIGKTLYELSDWGISIAAAGFVSAMRYYEYSYLAIFLMVWGANLLISWIFVLANDKTELDFTLMEGARNTVEVLYRKSRISGVLLAIAFSVKIVFWNGPDSFIIFVRKSLNSKAKKVTTFIGASAFQMAIWVALYTLGYESIWALFRSVF